MTAKNAVEATVFLSAAPSTRLAFACSLQRLMIIKACAGSNIRSCCVSSVRSFCINQSRCRCMDSIKNIALVTQTIPLSPVYEKFSYSGIEVLACTLEI